MSARNYTVTINVKDGGILKQLERLQSGGSGGSSGGGGGGGGSLAGGGFFDKLNNLGAAQLLKLGGIALGVTELVKLTVKSSGVLQGTLKLWENAMLLVFKPFGDFVGLLLRPWVLAMLAFAIPFYKTVGPALIKFAQDYGKNLNNPPVKVGDSMTNAIPAFGAKLAEGYLNLQNSINGVGKTIGDFTDNLGKQLTPIGGKLYDTFIALGSDIWTKLQNVPNALFGYFVSVGTSIYEKLAQLPNAFFGYFIQVGDLIYSKLTSVPQTIADVFTGLASDIAAKLASIPQDIRNAIMAWLQSLAGLGGATTTTHPSLASRFSNTNTRMQAIAASTTP